MDVNKCVFSVGIAVRAGIFSTDAMVTHSIVWKTSQYLLWRRYFAHHFLWLWTPELQSRILWRRLSSLTQLIAWRNSQPRFLFEWLHRRVSYSLLLSPCKTLCSRAVFRGRKIRQGLGSTGQWSWLDLFCLALKRWLELGLELMKDRKKEHWANNYFAPL